MDPLLQYVILLAIIAWLSRLAFRAGAAAGLPAGLVSTLNSVVQP